MATTTTLTSLSSPTPQSKELCSLCESQPYDLICTCGDKFDFNCIHQHVEQLSYEFHDNYEKITQKLPKVKDLKARHEDNIGASKTLIENWKRKRIQDINDIADKAINDAQQYENAFANFSSIQDTYDRISAELHRIVHDNLNILIKLNQNIHDTIDNFETATTLIKDDTSLDASLLSKINPQVLTNNVFNPVAASGATPSFSSSSNTNHHNSNSTIEFEPVTSLSSPPPPRSTSPPRRSISPPPRSSLPPPREYEIPPPRSTSPPPPRSTSPPPRSTSPPPRSSLPPPEDNEIPPPEVPEPTGPTLDLTNTTSTEDFTNSGTTHDEFDAGKTRHIRRVNPVVITVNNDRFAAAVCCHKNQMLYNDYDKTNQQYCLTFLTNINNSTNKRLIDWNQRGVQSLNGNDDEYIQDIIYSNKLSNYLILNRARLRSFNDTTNDLEEFCEFPNRTMKRLTCSDNYIYLTSTRGSGPYTGDEIILMNYQKEEQLSKSFRDIIPTRLNRGAGPMVGEISDIAAGANEQVAIGYRLERRHEVGVCLFNVTNDGREWSCVKQLLLNECWHSDLSYTPRLDWSEKLKVFILIEYITGHLIMIDREGQIEGECRFMQAENRQESPINLTISNSDLLAVRYASSISIHKLVS